MLRHVRLLPLAAIIISLPAVLPGQGVQTYRDPSGRFSVGVPNGWQAISQNGGVILTRGNASATVSPFQGANSSRELVGMLANQYGNQWRNFTPVNQGDFQLGGQPAAYATYSGVSPRGVNSVLRLSGTASRGQGFAFIISAPNTEFNQTSQDFQAIEGSFAIGSNLAPGNDPRGGGFNPANPNNPGNQPPTSGVVLGVQSRDVEQADLQQFGLRDTHGTIIAMVQPGSAADRAGVQPGDVVVAMDRAPLQNTVALRQAVSNHRAGDHIQLSVIRRGQTGTIDVTLAEAGGSLGNQPADPNNPGGGNYPGGNDPNNPGVNNPGGNNPGGINPGGTQPGVDPNAPPATNGDSTVVINQTTKGFDPSSPMVLFVVLVILGALVWRAFQKKPTT